MRAQERARGIAAADSARADLYDTLAQLKVQLNYAQRVDDAVDETKQRISEAKRKNPLAFAAGVAGVAVAAGLVAWGVAAAVLKRFD